VKESVDDAKQKFDEMKWAVDTISDVFSGTGETKKDTRNDY
jgi:hypothetical protein